MAAYTGPPLCGLDRDWPQAIANLRAVVPDTYGDAIMVFPWIADLVESHEWDNRTTVENATWLIQELTKRVTPV